MLAKNTDFKHIQHKNYKMHSHKKSRTTYHIWTNLQIANTKYKLQFINSNIQAGHKSQKIEILYTGKFANSKSITSYRTQIRTQ